jgi:ketopantoate reductase
VTVGSRGLAHGTNPGRRAGAIGRQLAARLAGAGIDTTLLGRGAAVQAIAAHGLHIEGDGAAPPRTIRVNAIEYRSAPGRYDAVFVCVKSHPLAGIAPEIASTIGRVAALVGESVPALSTIGALIARLDASPPPAR